MIQILWRCEECDDYGTIDLKSDYYHIQSDDLMNGTVQHQPSHKSLDQQIHHLILLNSLQTDPVHGIVVSIDKNENSGV